MSNNSNISDEEKEALKLKENLRNAALVGSAALKSFNDRLKLIDDSATRNMVVLNMLMFALDMSKAFLTPTLLSKDQDEDVKKAVQESINILTERSTDLMLHVMSPQYSTSHPFGKTYAESLDVKYTHSDKLSEKKEE